MGVSYMTVRQAMRALNDSGVLDTRQGIGTFVSGIKMERDFRQVLSFTEETCARGSKPSSKVLSFDIQSPTPKVQKALRLKDKDLVYNLCRVRYGDKVPMGIEYSSLPVQLFPGLIEDFNPEGSLYIELDRKYGVQLMVTDEVIEVGIATAEEARLLEIAPQSPVFLFTRISYIENGIPVEHAKSVYSGERYKIINRLMRTKH
jgi:GntR family transcriptional regulator